MVTCAQSLVHRMPFWVLRVRVRNRVRDKVRVRVRVSIRVRGCLCRMVYIEVALALIATCEHVGPCCVLVEVRLRVRDRTSEKVTTSDGSLPAAYLMGGTCPTAGPGIRATTLS